MAIDREGHRQDLTVRVADQLLFDATLTRAVLRVLCIVFGRLQWRTARQELVRARSDAVTTISGRSRP
jgi:hypothetical protein